MNRREFLKGGTLLAACLVAGLKPTEQEIIKSPVVDLLPPPGSFKAFCKAVWVMRGDRHINFSNSDDALYGGMAGGGKTPDPFADFEYYWINEHVAISFEGRPDAFNCCPDGGWLVNPQMIGDLLDATRHYA